MTYIEGEQYRVTDLPIGSTYKHITNNYQQFEYTIISVDGYGVNCSDGTACHAEAIVKLISLPNRKPPLKNRWQSIGD